MPYSGADLLAHLSELARQRAQLPRIGCIQILALQRTNGDLLQSALRAVVGYEVEILVAADLTGALRNMNQPQPQIVFILDDVHNRRDWFAGLVLDIRKAGLSCPLAIVLEVCTPQLRCQLLDLGVLDVIHRDEVCGLRLRECLLKLVSPSSSS